MTKEKDIDKRTMNRREFLSRSLKAGGCVAAAGLLGAWLFDAEGPSGRERKTLVSLGDYAVKDMTPRMAAVSGSDRRTTLRKAVNALGGIDQFIKKGDRVLIKVNAAFATPPILCATTHPDAVSEMIKICLEAGADEVRVTDNPINDPTSCFQLSGIGAAAEEAGASLYLPRDNYFQPTTVEGGELIRDWPLLFDPFDGVTKLIGMTPVKDHHRSGASMTMKNWYGLLGGRRNMFHQDIHNIIKELAMMVRPTFVVLDGTFTMMTNGPTGGAISDLKQTGLMIASTDQVAADALGSELLGKTPAELPFILKAEERGLGTTNYESISFERLNAEET